MGFAVREVINKTRGGHSQTTRKKKNEREAISSNHVCAESWSSSVGKVRICG